MPHKRKDALQLEENCRAAGLKRAYLRNIAEIAIRNYQRRWMPMLMLSWTPDTVPLLKDAVSILADIKSEYPYDRIEEALMYLSRLDMLDVLVEESVKYVREVFLIGTDLSYDVILTAILAGNGRENAIEIMAAAGVSRSVYFERKSDLLAAIGLALTCYSAKEAIAALGEW